MTAILPPAAGVYARLADLPDGFAIDVIAPMALPRGVILCPPSHFDVVDVKNPFMAGMAGAVDRETAGMQWAALRDAFARAGAQIAMLDALPGREDMVFCANSAFLGLDGQGRPRFAAGRMRFASRQPEVEPMRAWCEAHGYDAVDLGDPAWRFEGTGDAIWHPGRRLIWGGYGHRTDPEVYSALARDFDAPVLALALVDPTYYHLDTCFCPIDERTVLVYAAAIAPEGMSMVRRAFERVIEVDPEEAARFACNAAPLFGRAVVIDRRAARTAGRLRSLGYEVIEVDTGEFLKSGGSVFCMKNVFW